MAKVQIWNNSADVDGGSRSEFVGDIGPYGEIDVTMEDGREIIVKVDCNHINITIIDDEDDNYPVETGIITLDKLIKLLNPSGNRVLFHY
jgi:hypothetical protein